MLLPISYEIKNFVTKLAIARVSGWRLWWVAAPFGASSGRMFRALGLRGQQTVIVSHLALSRSKARYEIT